MFSRVSWMSRVGGATLMLGLVCGCPKKTTEDAQTFTLVMESNSAALNANLSDTAAVAVLAQGTAGGAPVNAQVQFTTNLGVFVTSGAADGGTGVRTVTVSLDTNGRGEVRFLCADAAHRPQTGNAQVQATLQPNGGDVTEEVHAIPVTITCNPIQNSSSLAFTAPPAGSQQNDGDRVEVRLSVTRFDGSPAAETTSVSIHKHSVGFQIAIGSTVEVNDPVLMHPVGGNVTFSVVYPGDGPTGTVGLPISLDAAYVDELGQSRSANLSFTYTKAANNSAVTFVDAQMVTGTPNILPRATNGPIAVDMSAAGSDGIRIVAEVRDRAGAPVGVGATVTFTCASSNSNNCRGFTGLGAVQPDAGTQNNLATALAFTETDPATPDHPARSVATLVFAPPSNSTPDTLTLNAEYKIVGGQTSAQSSVPITVHLVDASQIALIVTGDNQVESNRTGQILITARKGTSPLVNKELCASLDLTSQTRARLSDSDDDTRATALTMPTSATGVSKITVIPYSAITRGPAVVTITVVDQVYDAAGDTANTPCRSSDPSAQSFRFPVQITRLPVLASLVFKGVAPSTLGIRGSSLPTSSQVGFQLFNDENQPVSGVQVSFDLGVLNRDPSATVTPYGLTDATGNVVAFVSSGDQAAALVVTAVAAQEGSSVTAVSDPVVVVGGKPAWAPMQISAVGSTNVHSGRTTTGYQDRFGPNSRPQATIISTQLVDRFTNRVARAGYQVQFRAETGSIPSAAASDGDGQVSAPYIPGPPFNMETSPILGERWQVYNYVQPHQDTPQNVYRTGNPRDGDITILVATRGEESFVDLNGDGSRGDGRDAGPLEPFTDLPEPFLDRNSDGLRANCDYDDQGLLGELPVHHDLVWRTAGIGTYCNPFFDDPLDSSFVDPAYKTASGAADSAKCRAHWCPDWDPQWNCHDASNDSHTGLPRARTPEAQRVRWCPQWRYLDTRQVTVTTTPVRDIALGGWPKATLGGRSLEDGYVFFPGVTGIVPQDDGPRSNTPAERATLIWNSTPAPYGSFTYTGPAAGDTPGSSVVVLDALIGSVVNPPTLALSSASGARFWVAVDRDTLAALRAQGFTQISASFMLVPGDMRSPFDDFARDQLLVAQTDQFIDGNNNGVWDDVNGTYDADTMIWKTLTLHGSGFPYFNTSDWRYPGPYLNGAPSTPRVAVWGMGRYSASAAAAGPIQLYDRMHSFLHAIPDSLEDSDPQYYGGQHDVVSPTDHTGSSDYFVARFGQTVQFVGRFVDENGVPICPYNTGAVEVLAPDLVWGTYSWLSKVTPKNFSSCAPNGDFSFTLTIIGAEPWCYNGCVFGQPVQVTLTYDTKTGAVMTQILRTQGEIYSIPYRYGIDAGP